MYLLDDVPDYFLGNSVYTNKGYFYIPLFTASSVPPLEDPEADGCSRKQQQNSAMLILIPT